MNQLYDRIDGTVINNLSEVNNLANNDGFLIIWVWFITWVKVTPLTLKSKPLYRLVTCIFWLSLSLAQKHIDFYNFFNKLLALGYILLSASNILWGGGGHTGADLLFLCNHYQMLDWPSKDIPPCPESNYFHVPSMI